MELIKFKKGGGVVTIEIIITGKVTWRYKYVSDNKIFVKNSLSNPPFIHSLGLPHDLENDVNTWDIQIGNLSDEVQKYTIEIRWIQDDNLIHQWPKVKEREIKADSASVEQEQGLLVGI